MTASQQSVNQLARTAALPCGPMEPCVTHIIPRIAAIGTANPTHDIHTAFIGWAAEQLNDRREQAIFNRMASRSGIGHRWSVLPPTVEGGSPVAPGGFYAVDPLPPTSSRMTLYGHYAPDLALEAIAALKADLSGITHLVVASCTGFVAPGIDQIIAKRLGLAGSVERLLIGFMGCYAGVTALRTAGHIVRSEPTAKVLVVTVELSTLHLQPVDELEPLLAMLHFGDGAAAALVTGAGEGLGLGPPIVITLPDSEELIQWHIGDTGFAMHLSGAVPGRIEAALKEPEVRSLLTGDDTVDGWAVHAGGRTILDAVEAGLGLSSDALAASRQVLADFGNMSSATLLFALKTLMSDKPKLGVALAFGPGLAAEGLRLHWVDDAR
jgi:alpha-pyrone synthase